MNDEQVVAELYRIFEECRVEVVFGDITSRAALETAIIDLVDECGTGGCYGGCSSL